MKQINLVALLAAGALLTAAAPAPLPGVSARSEIPRTVSGEVPVRLTVHNAAGALPLTLTRNSQQDCAFAPDVRVLRVGTREVVYPTGQAAICTQEIRSETIEAGGAHTFERKLRLPAGEYMVEVWLRALDDSGNRLKVPAEPRRVSVK